MKNPSKTENRVSKEIKLSKENKENAQFNPITQSNEKGYKINESTFSPISNVYMNTVER
jgi:hypothetical protein